MKDIRLRTIATLLGLSCATVAYAQQPQPTATVPKLVRFSGSFRPATGQPSQSPAPSTESVTLSVYRDQTGGTALWQEVQNVAVDTDGSYSLLMGATQNEGMPLDLFSSGEPRWLGARFNRPGEVEQPRVLLVSVPYALKASDAETLGGRPASAYLLARASEGSRTAGVADVTGITGITATAPSTNTTAKPKGTPANSGQPNYIGKFTNTTDLIDSAMYELNGNIGISTTNPLISLDARTGPFPQMGMAQTVDYLTFFASDTYGPAIYWDPGKDMRFGRGGASLYNPFGFVEQMRIQSSTGNVGIGTMTPGSKLEVDTTTSGTAAIFGNNLSSAGSGVTGQSGSTTSFVAGVFGNETAATGTNVYGVSGIAASTGNGSAGVNGFESATTGTVFGVAGYTSSTSTGASGVTGGQGATTGQVYGVSGNTSSTTNGAAGVNGHEGATTGRVFGVAGSTPSTGPNAAGVNGNAGAATGAVYGVVGGTPSTGPNAAGVGGFESATTGQVYGVLGTTSSTGPFAAGVSGYEGATTGTVYGVQGTANSPDGSGVNGVNNATSGGNGVSGTANSANGAGVSGVNNAASGGTGGVFMSNSTSGLAAGVYGQNASTTGAGVAGASTAASGNPAGVWGIANSSGTAGEFSNLSGVGLVLLGNVGSGCTGNVGSCTTIFTVDSSGNGLFAGNLNVTGNLTKGSGSFKIDHPLDPENKYLSHSFVESPDMMNIYNGNVTTNERGVATVVLPDYFEALNGDFRYQLTVIGQFAQAIVAKKIGNGRFTIKTNRPRVEVSWQVTGVRHDAYANAHRIPVAEDKPSAEQGRYLHPDVVGKGESRQVGARR